MWSPKELLIEEIGNHSQQLSTKKGKCNLEGAASPSQDYNLVACTPHGGFFVDDSSSTTGLHISEQGTSPEGCSPLQDEVIRRIPLFSEDHRQLSKGRQLPPVQYSNTTPDSRQRGGPDNISPHSAESAIQVDLSQQQLQQQTPLDKRFFVDDTSTVVSTIARDDMLSSMSKSDPRTLVVSASPQVETCETYPMRARRSSPPPITRYTVEGNVKLSPNSHVSAQQKVFPRSLLSPLDSSAQKQVAPGGDGASVAHRGVSIYTSSNGHHLGTSQTRPNSDSSVADDASLVEVLRKQLALAQCRNKVLVDELNHTKESLNDTSVNVGVKEQECVELNDYVDSLHAKIELLQREAASNVQSTHFLQQENDNLRKLLESAEQQVGAVKHEEVATYARLALDVESKCAEVRSLHEAIAAAHSAAEKREREMNLLVAELADERASKAKWQQECQKVCALLSDAKVTIAEYTSVLDRVGLKRPFSDALIGSARRSASQLQTI